MTVPRIWLIAGLLLVLLTACAGDPEPPPPPPSSTTSTPVTTTFTPPDDVPRVANPLDDVVFEQTPCDSLTPAQVAEFKLGPGKPGTGDNPEQSEDGCVYADLAPKSDLLVYVNYYPDRSNGLSERYDQHWNGEWPLWRPGEVDGYPAVFFHYNPDDPTDCNVDVGVNDTQVFNVKGFYLLWKGYTGQDTCAQAKDIASIVLSNIKAAN